MPVLMILVQGTSQFIQGFKGPSFESQGTQLIPPSLKEIQPASILWDEQDLNFWPVRQRKFDLSREMNAEIIFDDQPTICRELDEDLSSSRIWLALSRPQLIKIAACPVAGSKAPCVQERQQNPRGKPG